MTSRLRVNFSFRSVTSFKLTMIQTAVSETRSLRMDHQTHKDRASLAQEAKHFEVDLPIGCECTSDGDQLKHQ